MIECMQMYVSVNDCGQMMTYLTATIYTHANRIVVDAMSAPERVAVRLAALRQSLRGIHSAFLKLLDLCTDSFH